MKSVAIALVLLSSGAFADSLKSQIQHGNDAVSKAIKAKNLPEIEKLILGETTPDFKHTEEGVETNRTQMVARMKMGVGMMSKLTEVTAKTIKVKESGNTAVATTEHVMTGVMAGADKKTHIMKFTGTTEDTYVKDGKSWKMSKMNWITSTQTLDGKPMAMRKG